MKYCFGTRNIKGMIDIIEKPYFLYNKADLMSNKIWTIT